MGARDGTMHGWNGCSMVRGGWKLGMEGIKVVCILSDCALPICILPCYCCWRRAAGCPIGRVCWDCRRGGSIWTVAPFICWIRGKAGRFWVSTGRKAGPAWRFKCACESCARRLSFSFCATGNCILGVILLQIYQTNNAIRNSPSP